MDDSKQRFDNQIGEEYDLFRLASPYHDEIQNEAASLLKSNLSKRKNITVVEIGFGTGITSKLILGSDPRINLLAVDNVEIMLAKAQKTLSIFPPNRFDLKINDALDFLKELPSNSADAIVSVWVLHNIEKNHRSDILKEIYRILRPEGIFINGDKIAESDRTKHKSNLEWQIKQFDVFDSINKSELKKEWTQHYYEDEKPDKRLIDNEFKSSLESIGFKEYKMTDRKYMDAIVWTRK